MKCGIASGRHKVSGTCRAAENRKVCRAIAIACAASMLVAAAAPPSASPQVKAFIEKQGIPLLEQEAGGRLEADVRKQHGAWIRRNVVAPSVKRLSEKRPDLKAEFEAIGEAVLPVAFAYPGFAFDEADLSASSAVLDPLVSGLLEKEEALASDPFLAWVAIRKDRAGSRNWGYVRGMAQTAATTEEYRQAPAAIRFLISLDQLDALKQGNHRPDHILGQMLENALACSNDPAVFTPAESEIAVRILSRAFDRRAVTHFPELCVRIAEGNAIPEWASETLKGIYETEKAWEQRGSGWGYMTTPDQQKSFRKHLTQAGSHLTKAYGLNPAAPIAPSGMIAVTMGGCGGKETEAEWLVRAIRAQFDFMPAYRSFIWSMRPRWGGDHNKMLAYALSCARTSRYDTLVPNEFFLALNGIVGETGAWEKLYADPLVGPVLLEVSREYLASPHFAHQRQSRQSYLVLNAWLGGFKDVAVEAFDEINGDFDPEMQKTAVFHGIDPTDLRGWLELRKLKLDRKWAALMADYDAEQPALALEKLDEIESGFPIGKAPELIYGMRSALDAETKIASGEWTNLAFPPDLAGWRVLSGDWKPGANATLCNKGHHAPGVILHRARVGDNFEARGRFRVESKGTCCHGAGIVIGHDGSAGDNANFITCAAAQEGQGPLTGRLLHGLRNSPLPKKTIGIHDAYDFTIKAEDGRITFTVNGIPVSDNQMMKTGGRDSHGAMTVATDGRIGFAHPRWCANNLTRFEKIEVRRLD